MVVKAKYSDGSTSELGSYTTVPANGTKLETAGNQTVVVSYEGKIDDFSVSVSGSGSQVIPTWLEGTWDFDATKATTQIKNGMVATSTRITVISDGKETVIYDYTDSSYTSRYTLSNPSSTCFKITAIDDVTTYYQFDQTGTTTVKVQTYVEGTLIVSSEAKKYEKEVESISIKTQPTKTSYYVGETVDTSGLVINVTYSDKSTEEKSSGFTVLPTVINSADIKAITVTYGGKTADYKISVSEQSVSNISIKTQPREFFINCKIIRC